MSSPPDLLARLQTLAQASTTTDENRKIADEWRRAIDETQEFIDDTTHKVVFLGNVGVGKSSLISVLSNLLIGLPPSDTSRLKERSVLATGSGRTTICEVRIRASGSGDEGPLGLVLDPLEDDELRKEIEDYARSEWTRQRPNERGRTEDDTDPAQEVQRAIRAMAGYADRLDTVTKGAPKRRFVRPLDDVISRFTTSETLAEHLLERANLPARTKKTWWWDACTEANLQALKTQFAAVNEGRDEAAPLPKRMTVVVADPLPGHLAGLDLTLIDTRGLDGDAASRSDLRDFLRDKHALIVLCASFNDAPGDSLRALLRSLATDATLQPALDRTLLVLLDRGQAEQVNGADGEREVGQDLKIDECLRALESAGLPPPLDRAQILAFDALKDDRGRLREVIDERLIALRNRYQTALEEQLRDAQSFLDTSDNQDASSLRASVDEQLRDTLARYPLPDTPPLSDPLAALYSAIERCRHAKIVYAACRRQGRYSRLELYVAVEAEASRAATAWLKPLLGAIEARLDTLLRDPTFGRNDHVRLRQRQFREGQSSLIRDYAKRVKDNVEGTLGSDNEKAREVWKACSEEWGKGGGFKNRVLELLKSWAKHQLGLTEHERTDAAKWIPLLEEAALPAQAPRFTLSTRNLRVLRLARWAPEPVSLLIGANGSGKTTLLLTLKLLQLAYERDLPEAVTRILGGSSNLKTWGVPSEAPVEIGLDIGEASWRIELTPREGSVDYLTNERLTDGGREIFSRDSLGNFSYGGERLESSARLGLRVLMDRGAHDPALRRVASFLQKIAVHYEPDLWTLRKQGSNTSEDGFLLIRGTNALTLLRRWRDDRTDQHRYQFVIEGLKAAFPGTVADLDFKEAGSTLVARVYKPEVEAPSPLEGEANGVLQLLVLFCEVAAALDESVVAIDEPENCLHPYALLRFLDRTSRWARQHNLTVLLATHSTVLLDALASHPEQVYVMKASATGASPPTRLDTLCDLNWLAGFKLGELYAQGEIGSNEDTL
jgi:predicted ATPase/GTPase SAR1 family protein